MGNSKSKSLNVYHNLFKGVQYSEINDLLWECMGLFFTGSVLYRLLLSSSLFCSGFIYDWIETLFQDQQRILIQANDRNT